MKKSVQLLHFWMEWTNLESGTVDLLFSNSILVITVFLWKFLIFSTIVLVWKTNSVLYSRNRSNLLNICHHESSTTTKLQLSHFSPSRVSVFFSSLLYSRELEGEAPVAMKHHGPTHIYKLDNFQKSNFWHLTNSSGQASLVCKIAKTSPNY